MTKSGERATAKRKWKDHIRSIQVASVFSPRRVKVERFKKAHPKRKADVNLQSAKITARSFRFL